MTIPEEQITRLALSLREMRKTVLGKSWSRRARLIGYNSARICPQCETSNQRCFCSCKVMPPSVNFLMQRFCGFGGTKGNAANPIVVFQRFSRRSSKPQLWSRSGHFVDVPSLKLFRRTRERRPIRRIRRWRHRPLFRAVFFPGLSVDKTNLPRA